MTDTVPMPYGKMMPDLRSCRMGNTYDTPGWLMVYCPNCGSGNVCLPNPTLNPEIDDIIEGKPSWGRWYCISCCDSWRYEMEK